MATTSQQLGPGDAINSRESFCGEGRKMQTRSRCIVQTRDKRKGFSLIELLIVVAIILIIAGIAIPNLLRSKMSANEASAVGSLHAINTASVAYNGTYGQYPTNLSNLGTNGTVSSTAADLIDSVLSSGTKGGYTFTYTSAASNTTYSILASPQVLNMTGQSYFYTDQTFVIRRSIGTTATSASTPIS
jgi:type IV pilus assembly protein PilA